MQPAAHYNNLAKALIQQGDFRKAGECYVQALSFEPNNPKLYLNYAVLLRHQLEYDKAIQCCQKAWALDPSFPPTYITLGNLLFELGKPKEAEDYYLKAISLGELTNAIYENLAAAYIDQQRISEAISCLETALRLNPASAGARYNLSSCLLLTGNFERGWALRDATWREIHGQVLRESSRFVQPRWAGEPIDGKTILLSAEQGLGDTLQFVRYASMVSRLGAQVIVECPEPLVRLLATVPGVSHVITPDQSLPAYDIYCPILSLPVVFATTLSTVPATVPYVAPDSDAIRVWETRIGQTDKLKVGLVWAGGLRDDPAAQSMDRKRSFNLSVFSPLGGLQNIQLYSLQMGNPAMQARSEPWVLPELIDLTDHFSDFMDTAGLVANLDLVISVDTSTAHLAGAMGKPVWLLSRFDGCWRWLLDRHDSPWYPTMRIFRQDTPGDWGSVICNVVDELKRYTARLRK